MRALQLIPNSDLGFSKPKLWSKPLLDFIASCLIKNPQQRPSAASLSKSLFLEKAKDMDRNSVMRDLIFRSRNMKERVKHRKDEDEDDKEDEEISDSNKLFSPGGSSVITDTLQHAKDVILNNPLVNVCIVFNI
jgi:serine/threonine protein kinase